MRKDHLKKHCNSLNHAPKFFSSKKCLLSLSSIEEDEKKDISPKDRSILLPKELLGVAAQPSSSFHFSSSLSESFKIDINLFEKDDDKSDDFLHSTDDFS